MAPVSLVVVTDLDGTLLDHDSYSASAAAGGLELLARHAVPLVFCSSKTRAEVELVQRQLGVRAPFISENGGALFVPDGYFPFPIDATRELAGWHAVEFGRAYSEVVSGLHSAATLAGVEVRGFSDMSADEVARECRMPLDRACLAKRREYDEPFRVRGRSARCRWRLFRALGEQGLFWTSGARFEHATGASDKGVGIRRLRTMYARAADAPVVILGLGDGLNDVPLLHAVDIPVIVRNSAAGTTDAVRRQVPVAHITAADGPAGWSEAIEDILGEVLGGSPGACH